jgi:hypothetical protein
VAVRAAQEVKRGLGNVLCLDCSVHADPRRCEAACYWHGRGDLPAVTRGDRGAGVFRSSRALSARR